MPIPQPIKPTVNPIAGPGDVGKRVVAFEVPYAYFCKHSRIGILAEYRKDYLAKYKLEDGSIWGQCLLWEVNNVGTNRNT